MFAALLLSPASAQAPAFDPVAVQAYVDGAMRQAMTLSGVAGATVAVVKDGEILVATGYGLGQLPDHLVDSDMVFQLASISKTGTYIAIMQLVEAGKISLDDPVNKHLPPALRIPDQGFAKPILIRHLMTHSAGLEDSALGHLFVDRPDRLTSMDSYLRTHRPNRVREPGIRTSYSNYGVVLLGAVIEHESGIDFPTYMENHILFPLGMTNATYRDNYPYTPDVAKARGLPRTMFVTQDMTQQLDRDAGTGKWRERGPEFITMIAPAGGLRASAHDMMQYLEALTDPARLEAKGVLKASTFAMMLRPGVNLPGTEHLGFLHYWLPQGYQGFGHNGAMAFGASDMVIVPDLKLGIFIATNGRGGFAFTYDFVRRFLQDFARPDDDLYSREPKPVRTPATIAMASDMAGDWIYDRRPRSRTEAVFSLFGSAMTITPQGNGDIVASSIAGETNRYEPLGHSVWRSVRHGDHLIYAPDPNGVAAIWKGNGAGSAARAGLFERPLLLLILFGASLIAATVIAGKGVGRVWRSRNGATIDRVSEGAMFGAGLAWMFGLGGFLTVLVKAIPDGGAQLIFDYPGPVVAIAWSNVLATALTVVTLIGAILQARRTTGALPRRLVRFAVLVLFLITTVACWKVGLLGYSGF